MKQHITIQQIKELNSEQMRKLKEILAYFVAIEEGDKFYIDDDTDYIRYVCDGYDEEEKEIQYTTAYGIYVVVKKNNANFDIYFPHYEELYLGCGEFCEVPILSYYIDDERVFPLLSIGKMIEILDYMRIKVVINGCVVSSVEENNMYFNANLCDSLWYCIKAHI